MPGQFGLPANAQGLFAASEEQQKLAQEQAAAEQALAAQQAEPISTEDLVANMQAARSPEQQNLAANQVAPSAEQLAVADQKAAETPPVVAAIPEPAKTPSGPVGPQIGTLTDTTSTDKTRSEGTNPANITQINSGTNQQKLGAKEQADVNIAKSLEDLEIAKKAAAKEVVQQSVFQAAEAARAEKVRVSEKASADAIDEVARTKINPNAYFQDMGMGGKVISLIGVALGGMGAGTGPNVALDIFEKASAANIDAQKANLANKREVASFKSSAYARTLEATGNERQAQLTQQAADLGMFRRQLETTIRNPQLLSATQKAAYDTTIGQIDARDGKIKAEIQKTVYDHEVKSEAKQAVLNPKGGNLPLAEGGRRDSYVAAQQATVETRKLATKVRESAKELGPFMARFNSALDKFGIAPDQYVQLSSEQQKDFLKNAKLALPGTLTENDLKRVAVYYPELTKNPQQAAKILEDIADSNERKVVGYEANSNGYESLGGRDPEYDAYTKKKAVTKDARKAGK